ncbi:Uncharacterized protein DBV15_03816 [Temnothorax longispinosus]|uniref:Uncharacterized protein n=1 Tax=Temnothorax longispinosus TaxID=300112 RepID=A0A4V3S647_9HYME|nr:Uncharacterized protein DBV15_03816 [Temnothorax longispinosus]
MYGGMVDAAVMVGECSQRRLSPPLGSGFGIRPLPAEWALKHHSSSMGDNLRTRRIFERKYESSLYETHCGST